MRNDTAEVWALTGAEASTEGTAPSQAAIVTTAPSISPSTPPRPPVFRGHGARARPEDSEDFEDFIGGRKSGRGEVWIVSVILDAPKDPPSYSPSALPAIFW